jgi:hypothetical protein
MTPSQSKDSRLRRGAKPGGGHRSPLIGAVSDAAPLASVVTWTVWLAKIMELRRARRGARAAL